MSLYLTVDDRRWTVERIHEMAQLMRSSNVRERKLYLLFKGHDGEIRKSEIPETFPEDPPADMLATVWRHAEVIRPRFEDEAHSRGGLAWPGLSQVLVTIGRALRLRCPHCGQGTMLKSWFSLKSHCDACGMRYDRGEREDYYLGGMMFNIILAEAVFLVVFGGIVFAMWPNVPWDNLEYVLVGAMIAAPIILYPVSRIVWLGFDLLFRPVTEEEMAWHHQHIHNTSHS